MNLMEISKTFWNLFEHFWNILEIKETFFNLFETFWNQKKNIVETKGIFFVTLTFWEPFGIETNLLVWSLVSTQFGKDFISAQIWKNWPSKWHLIILLIKSRANMRTCIPKNTPTRSSTSGSVNSFCSKSWTAVSFCTTRTGHWSSSWATSVRTTLSCCRWPGEWSTTRSEPMSASCIRRRSQLSLASTSRAWRRGKTASNGYRNSTSTWKR